MKQINHDEQKVVSMLKFQGAHMFPVIMEVEAYWEGLRAGRLVPLRSEIDPRGIERALQNTFILERISVGLARFRLSGQHLNDLLGMEVRGMPFTSFFTPTARLTVSDALRDVFDGPHVIELTLTAERGIGKPAMDGKVILLPLRSDLGEVTRVMGCFVTSGPLGRAPRRFDVSEVRKTKLVRGNIMPEDTTKHVPDNTDVLGITSPHVPGFSEYRTPFRGARNKQGRPERRTPELRLVKSDDE